MSRIIIKSCLILSALVALVQSAPTVVSFKQNMDQVMKQWNCNKPQPRLVYLGTSVESSQFNSILNLIIGYFNYLEDEYDDYNPSAIYLPHAAVVQRCGKSVGCCKNGQICASADIEPQTITFVFEQILRGKKVKKEIQLVNHTRCECQTGAGSDSPRR